MPRTTRSKAGASTGAGSKTTKAAPTSTSRYTLPEPSDNPPKVFILPRKATPEARIVSLLNPRYSKPTRYLVCPETGIYEFTRIAAPKSTPRSWLIVSKPRNDQPAATTAQDGEEENTEEEQDRKTAETDSADFRAAVTKGADLYIATPVDPVFLLLPALGAPDQGLFVGLDEHLDTIQSASPHLWEVLRWGDVRARLEARAAAVCATKRAGDDPVFRLSLDRLLAELLRKAAALADAGCLPRSLEERFVARALEAPVLGVKRQQQQITTTAAAVSSTCTEAGTATPATLASAESGASEASTAMTSVGVAVEEEEETTTMMTDLGPSIRASEQVVRLQRQRVAFEYMCSAYVPPALTAQLKARLLSSSSSPSPVDFAPLDAYLASLAALRAEAAATRSAGDYSRKRALDDEELAERAEAKRRREEDEKRRKAGESRGVRDLKKVNTAGMRKMSDFFKKKT
ncbi:ribonuclease H2, subunit B [Xylariomycetidae sp. FL0641]|nr:ribonuclease H2, subunit B [Xylariomycetidae sp. FL0641]